MFRPLRRHLLPALALATALAAAPTAVAAEPRGTVPLAPGSQPEGITSGPGTTYFAGSLADGAVYRGDLLTGARRLLVPGRTGASLRGLQYGEQRHVLWAVGDERTTGSSTRSTITKYDADTGRVLRRVIVPGQRFLNDIVITGDRIYVTDSLSSQLVVVDPDGSSLLPLSGDFGPVPPGEFGANGIRQLENGDLVITDSSSGGLFRVDRDTGVTDRIELTGRTLRSGDGLVISGSLLFVIRPFAGNGIAVVRLAPDGRSGEVTGTLTDPDLDVPSTGLLAAGALYAVNARFGTPPTRTTAYDIVRVGTRP